jgi:hypothetical protein
MSVKHVTINGSQKVWMARIAYRGVRKSRVCRTKEEARQAERELSAACRQEAERAEREGASPATVKHLCEYYVLDLERRGKGPATIGRAVTTAKAIEAVAPALLAMPVSRVTARDVYDFRQARLVAGSKPSTINRDLRSLRAMLKQARPDFRFPGSAFLPEDETRVRWLRPEEDPRAADDALALPRDGHAGRAHAHAPGRNHRAASRARAPRTGRDHAPTCQGGRPAGDPKRGGTEDPPRPARGPRERLGVPRAIRRAVPPGLRRPHVPEGGPGGRAARLPLSRPATPRRHHGAQPGIHGADRDGAGRMEDRADDAAVRGSDRSDATGGGRGRQWQ